MGLSAPNLLETDYFDIQIEMQIQLVFCQKKRG